MEQVKEELFIRSRNGGRKFEVKLSTVVFSIVLSILACLLTFAIFSQFSRKDLKITFFEYTVLEENQLRSNDIRYAFEEGDKKDATKAQYDTKLSVHLNASCFNVPSYLKFDCYPDAPVTEEQCVARGCCWKVHKDTDHTLNTHPPLSVPYCYFPSDFLGYRITEIEKHDSRIYARLQRMRPSGFPDDIRNVKLLVSFEDKATVRIKLTDAEKHRYVAVLPVENTYQVDSGRTYRSQRLYDVQLQENGALSIIRLSSNQIIFSTNLSTLIFADQFLQLSSLLPSHFIYGLGQHKTPLLHNLNWQRLTMFNRDRAPVVNKNLYGSHPFYLSLEEDGNSHGVFLLNTNSMDVILQPTPAITFRPIGGIFDFFLFLGPSPKNVVQQYTRVIGRTFMPPYWGLGFHLCRFGYYTLNNTRAVWNRTRMAGIPFDTQWNDIDYMISRNDFTYDKTRFKGLPDFVDELHKVGMHYIPIVDPGISNAEPPGTYPPYDDGVKMNIFVRNSTGQIFIGKVWNKVSTVFPDFTHPNATKYWTKQFRQYHNEVKIDGAWIDMNEPSNFYDGQINGCPNSTLENPQYVPGTEPLRTKTLCMTCKHYITTHYNIHNIYGLTEAVSTNKALRAVRNKRPFIISRSSFPSIGHFVGNWDGDISSTWEDMKWTIPSILNFNMFGIPVTGADICGFNGNTTVELCARWSALGAFYPFSRNHNSDDCKDQDPVALGPVVVAAAKKSLTTRYFLLPYLYTLFYKSHSFGDPVARPLFFEYSKDRNTYAIDTQFLWGPALMVMPTLEAGVSKIFAYLPNDIWYDFYTGKRYPHTGLSVTLSAPLDKINLAVRGGYILPAQNPAATTTQSRQNDFALIVAFDNSSTALGDLFWDDGDSIGTISSANYTHVYFHAHNQTIETFTTIQGYPKLPSLGSVKIFGCTFKPKSVEANGVPVAFKYDSSNKVLSIPHLKLSLLKRNTVKWR